MYPIFISKINIYIIIYEYIEKALVGPTRQAKLSRASSKIFTKCMLSKNNQVVIFANNRNAEYPFIKWHFNSFHLVSYSGKKFLYFISLFILLK